MHPRSIVILDFGGQYAHLIARRVRQCGVYSEILPPETPAEQLKDAAGIILSGGPQSVYDAGSPQADPQILQLGIPVLGLCYGLHWMTQTLGGTVKGGHVKEYGKTLITIENGGGPLLQDCGDACTVWMSHGDEAATLPDGFSLIASSDTCRNAAFADESRKLFALQFHPEVTHTEHGFDMLQRFVALCDAAPWAIENYSAYIGEQVKREVNDRKVFMLVSGGVDSTVAFTLLNQVLGKHRVIGLLVDTGLMRKGEVQMIQNAFEHLGVTNFYIETAHDIFLSQLREVYDPEEKRKVIGNTFLEIQQEISRRFELDGAEWMLGQGTIYPDTIETGGSKHADKIKTHHNRVDAIQQMIEKGLVIEPLKELYKDEVRALGEELGLPHDLVWRHPFPGPGLGVRILCASGEQQTEDRGQTAVDGISLPHRVLPVKSVGVQGDGRTYRHALAFFHADRLPTPEHWKLATTIPNSVPLINRVLVCTSHAEPVDFVFTPGYLTKERADLLREADAIVLEEMQLAGLYEQIWQFPVVLLPFGTQPRGQSIVLRPISSVDVMSVDAYRLPDAVLSVMTDRILALPGIDLVFLDLTNKPPATVEWE